MFQIFPDTYIAKSVKVFNRKCKHNPHAASLLQSSEEYRVKKHIEKRNCYARYFPDTYKSKSEIQKCLKVNVNITLVPHCPPAV